MRRRLSLRHYFKQTKRTDSKGNYVSTYCHRFHRHVLGFTKNDLMLCGNCAETKESEETR